MQRRSAARGSSSAPRISTRAASSARTSPRKASRRARSSVLYTPATLFAISKVRTGGLQLFLLRGARTVRSSARRPFLDIQIDPSIDAAGGRAGLTGARGEGPFITRLRRCNVTRYEVSVTEHSRPVQLTHHAAE